jgi:O-acetylhomoserine/O-acetylserine sulfhydrylase-like pyridoxal-dependent enzyme
MADERGRRFSTRAVHGAKTPWIEQETPSVPIFQTSLYRFADSDDYADTISFRKPGFTYTRGYGNPTTQAFEALMADLEGTEGAFSFASGMAAMHTVFTTLAASGDRIVSSNELYGGAYSLFTKVMPRYGVSVDLVDPHDLDAVASALPGAAFFYVETIANPNVTVADLEALGALCRAQGVSAVVDSTFASPYLCNPTGYGFDYVLHSATKFIGGHNDLIGGVVCASAAACEGLRDTVIDTGGTMAPFEAWLCMRGLVTLSLRMERHCESTAGLATFLESHPKVERVWYPALDSHPHRAVAERILPHGCGGVLAVEVAGGVDGGKGFCDAVELAWVATSLGGAHTLVSHAASTTHRQMDPGARRRAGIADSLVRVSVGLEDLDDLVDDFDRALEKM